MKQKKIILLNTNLEWGSSERWTLGAAEHLKKNNFQVELICAPHSKLGHDAARFDFKVKEIAKERFSFIRNMKNSQLQAGMEGADAVLILADKDLRAGILAAEKADVKNIVYRHSSPEPIKNTSLNRKLFARLDHIVVNSKEVSKRILLHTEEWFPKEKLLLVYDGLDLDRLQNSSTRLYRPAEGEVVLGSAGRLVESKGHQDLIRMAKLLKDQDFKFHLLIAGYGELEKELKGLAQSLGVAAHVDFLGYVKDMPAFYNTIDYFVFASISEGCPDTLLEAMAYKKICFAYDTSSISEALDYTNGYLSPAKDYKDMAYKVAHHSQDNLGEHARATISERFNYTRNMQKLLDVLK